MKVFWLAAWCVGAAFAAETNSLLIDDFERGEPAGWWISGSGDYYKGGSNRRGLDIVKDAARGSRVLHAHVRFPKASPGRICFITRKFKTPQPLLAYDRISFWFKLTTARLRPRRALLCRLRVGPRNFVDLTAAEPETIRPGRWTRADLRITGDPAHIRNVYNWILKPTTQITFRMQAADDTPVEFDFYVDDIRLHPKPRLAFDYAPRVSRLHRGAAPRFLFVRQAAAGYYRIEDALRSLPQKPQIHLARFRGLHLPLSGFPATRDALFGFDAVVMVDVDPYVVTPEQMRWLTDYVASGGGLLFVAGPNTFGRSVGFGPGMKKLLPVEFAAHCAPRRFGRAAQRAGRHPVVDGVPERLGDACTGYPLKPKPDAQVLLRCGETAPAHWGTYTGGGPRDAAVELAPGHDSPRAAWLVTRGFYINPKTGRPQFLSVALIAGDSDGYRGARAKPCKPGTTYRFSFWLKGDLPWVEPAALAWRSDAARPADRQWLPTSLGRIRPAAEWRRYEGEFTTRPDSKRLVFCFRFRASAKGFQLGKGVSVDDLSIVEAKTGAAFPVDNAGAEDADAAPALVAGRFGKGRVLVLNAYPAAADRLSPASLFNGPFFDELIRDAARWLARRDAAARFDNVRLSRVECDPGQTAELTARARAAGRASLVVRATNAADAALPAGAATTASARVPGAARRPQTLVLRIEARTPDGALAAFRDAPVRLHAPAEAEIRFARWGVAAPGQRLAFRVEGRFRGAAKNYAGRAEVAAALVDAAGATVLACPAQRAAVENGRMAPVAFAPRLPDLLSGDYRLTATLRCLDAAWTARTSADAYVAAPLDLRSVFLIMGVSGIQGGGQAMDPAMQRARVDELWAHGFTAVTADSPAVVEEAARKGMALFKDYTSLTLCGRKGHSNPCVFAPEHEAALERRVARYVDLGESIPNCVSLKFKDEPSISPGALAKCPLCRAAFQKRFGYEFPDPKTLAELPVNRRIDVARFMADYVRRSYAAARRICQARGARFALAVTYHIGGFGGAGARGMEDSYTWSLPADYIDYDNYIYFYPTSQRIRYVGAHYCYGMLRGIAHSLGKTWGHYTEIDDRNYPYQVNPVEASSQHTYVALAEGVNYVNTFITRSFATGCGARDARWADFGREACKIRSVGALLNRLRRPASELALYFPQADYYSRVKEPHRPRYAYELLIRAFGDADVAHEAAALRKGFAGRKALVLCDTRVLPDAAAARINEFVRAGGLLICDRIPRHNDRGEPCQIDPKLFQAGAVSRLGALATVRSVAYGRGRCLLLDRSLDKLYYDAVETPRPADEKLLREWVWRTLRGAGLKPHARPAAPDFETGLRLGDDTALLVVVSLSPKRLTRRVEINGLPFKPRYVVELPSYKPVEFRGGALDATLAPRHGKMIAFYPAKPAKLRLHAQDAPRGGRFSCSVELFDAAGAPCRGARLVELVVRDPQGVVRRRFGGRWTTTNGRLTRAVAMPVNAPLGRWTVECRALGTPLSARAAFRTAAARAN